LVQQLGKLAVVAAAAPQGAPDFEWQQRDIAAGENMFGGVAPTIDCALG
jgi:hypothetical protein